MATLTRSELKNIKSLHTKKGRKQKKQFLAEGVRLLEEVHRHGVRPITVLASEADLSDRGRELVARFRRQGIPIEPVTSRVMAQLSAAESASGLLAVLALPESNRDELEALRHRRVLMCESVADPGNLGTLMRSALAFGFGTVLLSGATADPYSPKVVRASAGSLFGLRVLSTETMAVISWARRSGAVVVAADAHGQPLPTRLRPGLRTQNVLLAVGAEAEGLSETALSAAHERWRIVHRPEVESLNVGVAGSILMHSLYRAEGDK